MSYRGLLSIEEEMQRQQELSEDKSRNPFVNAILKQIEQDTIIRRSNK